MKIYSMTQFKKMLIYAMTLTILVTGFQFTAMTTPKAQAADVNCSGQSACFGTVAQVVVGGNQGGSLTPGGSGPTPVGSDGVVKAPNPPMLPSPDGEKFTPRWRITLEFEPWNGSPSSICKPKNINGFMVDPAGIVMEWHEQATWESFKDDSEDGYRYEFKGWHGASAYRNLMSMTCVYPEVPVVRETKTCIISYNAQIDRMAQSRLGAANGLAYNSGTVTSVEELERNGRANCVQSKDVSLFYDPPHSQDGWGQYRATSRIDMVTCRFASTTFDGVTNELGDCGGITNAPGTVGKITLWCDGAVNDWVIKSWTGVDCINSGPTQMKCVIPDAATYNGYANNVQALRDGNDGTVKWGNPTIIGGWGDTNWRSSTFINGGSTPRKTGVGDNDANGQMFRSSVPFSANKFGMIGGKNLDQKLAFYTAGDSGAPFSMTRNYLFDGWSNTRHVEMRGFNLSTGQITTSSYLIPTYSVNNACGPQQSPNISVIRAIGDKIG